MDELRDAFMARIELQHVLEALRLDLRFLGIRSFSFEFRVYKFELACLGSKTHCLEGVWGLGRWLANQAALLVFCVWSKERNCYVS
jgi:hypothetical protein